MNLSYWERQNLENQRGCIVIGAGLVGLSAAIEVKKLNPNLSVLVIDKAKYGAAASTRNAGFACFGSVSEIYSDIESYGEEAIVNLVHKRRAGINHITKIFGQKKIGYTRSGGYEIFRNKEDFGLWESKLKYINKILNEEIFSVRETPNPLAVYGKCIFNKSEGQLNTGHLYKELNRLARKRDIEIVRGIEVVKVNEKDNNIEIIVEKERLEVQYDKLIIASNALTKSFYPDLSVEAVRNQVFITEPIENHGLRGCYHLDRGYVYFRDVEDRVLIGGARNLFPEEETPLFGQNASNIEYLYNMLVELILPDIKENRPKIAHVWSGILCGGNDRMPLIERISDDLTIAVRLSGMGVAIGIDVGKAAAALSLK